MESANWKEEELKHLGELWNVRPKGTLSHTREVWNERAHDWEKFLREEGSRQTRSERRVRATADYLIERGVLGPQTTLIDIGCGPGRFVAEFAKTAMHADGLDISDQMAEYGLKYCHEKGITNVSFFARDFNAMDPEAEGLIEKYDLVFASITPALGHKGGYEKALQMTNGWFFNANFISVKDSLQSALSGELGIVPVRSRDGAGFYCMINELILKGYYPELTYFRESDRDEYSIGEACEEYGRWFFRDGADDVSKKAMRDALEKLSDGKGKLTAEKEWVYAWVLVDKRERNIHEKDTKMR